MSVVPPQSLGAGRGGAARTPWSGTRVRALRWSDRVQERCAATSSRSREECACVCVRVSRCLRDGPILAVPVLFWRHVCHGHIPARYLRQQSTHPRRSPDSRSVYDPRLLASWPAPVIPPGSPGAPQLMAAPGIERCRSFLLSDASLSFEGSRESPVLSTAQETAAEAATATPSSSQGRASTHQHSRFTHALPTTRPAPHDRAAALPAPRTPFW